MINIKIPWQVYACAGLVVSWFCFYFYGKHVVQVRWDDSISRGKTIVADLKEKQPIITTKIETVYVDRIKTIKEKGDVIVKQVPVFIPKNSCDLPGGFRLLHDAAVNSAIPSASEIPNAEPVSIEDTTKTITENYTTCNSAIAELNGLRSWVNEQQALLETQTLRK